MRTVVTLFVLCLALMAADSRPNRAFTMTYEATVRDVPEDAASARLWIPIPVSTPDQEISNVTVSVTLDGESVTRGIGDLPETLAVGDAEVACTLADVEHGTGKSLCLETEGIGFVVRLTFDCRRYATQSGGKATPEELTEDLEADRMVKLGGKVSAVANGMETASDTMKTARMLYDNTLERMKYDKPAGGEWGRGDSEWACDSRYGNCTDFHSYFMALARTKGIPARFEIGFPIPDGDEAVAKVGGYHCWAFFYDDARGWIPVDISEADKHPEKAEFFFGNLDENRVTMTGGRDLLLSPRPAAGSLNFFVYPYLEIDGKDATKTNVDKSFERTNK